jgi:phage terminase Nu1 subunit (DNA packaging protein)
MEAVPVLASNSLTVVDAAAQLGLSPRQLHYAVRQGAPVVTRGAKGKGNKTIVNPDDIRRWMANRDQSAAQTHKLARRLIEAVAQNTALQFRAQSGPHKLVLLTNLLANFYATASAIRRQLGLPPLAQADVPSVIAKMDAASVYLGHSGNLKRT